MITVSFFYFTFTYLDMEISGFFPTLHSNEGWDAIVLHPAMFDPRTKTESFVQEYMQALSRLQTEALVKFRSEGAIRCVRLQQEEQLILEPIDNAETEIIQYLKESDVVESFRFMNTDVANTIPADWN